MLSDTATHGPKGDGYGAGGTPMDDDIPFAPQVL